MNISERGLRLITSFEGVVLRLYNDPAGHCTVGVGHLVHLGPCDGRATEAPFRSGLSEQQALDLLRSDVRAYADAVERFTNPPLNQNQFDAMTSFCYNIGTGGYASSRVLSAINSGRWGDVCAELRKIIYGVGNPTPLLGLVRRREAECALFNIPSVEEDDMEILGQYADKAPGWAKSYLVFVDANGNVKKAHVKSAEEYELLVAAGFPVKRFSKIGNIPSA